MCVCVFLVFAMVTLHLGNQCLSDSLMERVETTPELVGGYLTQLVVEQQQQKLCDLQDLEVIDLTLRSCDQLLTPG